MNEPSGLDTAPVADTDGGGVISLRNLNVAYGPAIALRNLSIDISAGEVIAVLGANGAGKSTLARACAGLVPLRSGRKLLDGRDVTRWPPYRLRRAGVVYLPETRGIFPSLTVYENLVMAATLVSGRQARQLAVDRCINLFPILGARRGQKAGSLSGGEQQMLSLARAAASNPRIIIADELSLGLAPQVVDLVFASLDQLRIDQQVTILLIEQFVRRALAFADSCVILRRGEVAWRGPTDAAAAEAFTAYIGPEPVAPQQ